MEMNSIGEYIDQDEALSRIGGNMNLYKKLLGRFADGSAYDELERAIHGSNMEEAAHQAHSLKGVSANLSLTKIRSLSTQLEQLLKDKDDYSSCLVELKIAYYKTVDIINEIR